VAVVSVRTIEAEAFKCFSARVVVDLGVRGVGLHFVRGINRRNPRLGANGVGKSSLWDALCWCLYGKTVKGRPTTSVKPWQGKKAPRVATTLNVDGRAHVIERSARAMGVTIDGVAVGQEDVEALVGLSYELFTQAVVLGQGRPLFFDKTAGEKMQLLSDVLGLERWEARATAAKRRVDALQSSLTTLAGERAGLGTSLENAGEALARARAAADRWGDERARTLAAAEEEVRRTRATFDERGAKLAEAELLADGKGMDAKLSRPGLARLREELAAAREAAAEKEELARSYTKGVVLLSDQIAALEETGTCSLCGQAVKKADAAKHLKRFRADREALTEELQQTRRQAETRRDTEAALANKLAAEEERLEELEAAERAASDEMLVLERGLGAARAELAAAERRATELEEQGNPHREAVSAAREQLRDVKATIKEVDDEVARYERSVERAKFWVKGFRDIRLMIIEDVLADLRDTTAVMLEELGLGDWEIDYSTEKENKSGTRKQELTVSVTSPESGGPQHWEDWSGGEGQRLRLAGALALSEVLLAHAGVRLDLRVLDEPTRGLAAEGVRDLCELLANYAEEAGLAVWFIDHMAVESSRATSTMTAIGGPSGSTIE
jgi:DNA repair exonuclease SbcCD ATPase subunit